MGVGGFFDEAEETTHPHQEDSDGKCGFGGRDVARNVSTTASIRVIRGSCPDFTIRVQDGKGEGIWFP
jgi:hypothetical protein